MTIPEEVAVPIKEFFFNYFWLIIVVTCLITGVISIVLLEKNNSIEQEGGKIIESESEIMIEILSHWEL